jgi:hypothetical protein
MRGRTQQFSARRERVDEVHRCLDNYHELKEQSRRSASSIMSCCARLPALRSERGRHLIEMRRAQLSFGDLLIAEEVGDLHDYWMKAADRALADAEFITAVYEARRNAIPRAVAVAAKGWRQKWYCACWSSNTCATGYVVLEREVRANYVRIDQALSPVGNIGPMCSSVQVRNCACRRTAKELLRCSPFTEVATPMLLHA